MANIPAIAIESKKGLKSTKVIHRPKAIINNRMNFGMSNCDTSFSSCMRYTAGEAIGYNYGLPGDYQLNRQ
jgi:hypothetical protein